MTVDPKVYALAESFVEDVEKDAPFVFGPARRKEIVQRAAEAMQMAIEHEMDAIRKELQG